MANGLKFNSIANLNVVEVMDQTQLIYVLTEVAPEAMISNVRLPLNFALVLDRSGSMTGEKLRTMKQAVSHIIDQLNEQDILSIVTFESRSEVLVGSQPVRDKNALKRMVEKIRDGGGTNVAPALATALRLVSQHANDDRVSRIILLTDGEATDREEDSFRVASEAGARHIPLIGLGFGKDWKEEFLFDLADRSIQANPGSHIGMADYIPVPEKTLQIFQEVFQSMQVVAQDVKITFRMVQGLEARRIWQVVPIIRELGSSVVEGRSIQFPVGQLERHGAAFLVEVVLPPRPEGAVRIAQADVTFSTPDLGAQRQALDLVIHYTREQAADGLNPHSAAMNERVMNVVEKVHAFRLQTQALEDAQIGDVDNATRKLRQAVTILLSAGENELALQMGQEADRLEQSGEVSSEGKKTIMLTSRKTVRLSEG